MLKTKVKAGPITNLTDARYFAAKEVEWLSFSLEPGLEGYIPPATMATIREWVDGVRILGEFHTAPPGEILMAVQMLRLDAVQVGMFFENELLAGLSKDIPVIKEIVVEKTTTKKFLESLLDTLSGHVQAFLLNFQKNRISWEDLRAGQPISLAILRQFCNQYRLILGFDFTAPQLSELFELASPFGIILKGGEEERTGYKSFEELDDLFEILELEV